MAQEAAAASNGHSAAGTNRFHHHHQNGGGDSTAGKVITCKAAVAWGPGEPLILEEVEVDPPQAMEVRVRVMFTSICHSDLGAWLATNEAQRAFPRIFGHEASGVIESVGAGVTDLCAGDHVVAIFNGECGSCTHCDPKRKTNLCAKYRVDPLRSTMRADGKTRFFVWRNGNRTPVYHFLNTSTFSEYTVLDSACVSRIPPQAPLDRMCLLSCSVSTGVGAAWNTADVKEGSTVAVFGLGAVGLAAVQGARVRGASRIIGVDVNPDKYAKGLEMGVTDFVNPKDCGVGKEGRAVHELIRAMADGGVDYSFECVGNVSVLREAFLSSHDGWGLTVVLGIHPTPDMLPLHPMELFDGRRITACAFGDVKGKSQLPCLVDKCLDGTLKLDGYITHELPLEEINQAFKLLQDGKSLRCLLHMAAAN